ncbi:MAG: hypothetical protein LBJ10_01255 [Clostridiales bacterium]|jgi:folylpolyglutamate synthase/dihydropteroate synthase|nr:hypothetical protein [Clostridiales bacterium]
MAASDGSGRETPDSGVAAAYAETLAYIHGMNRFAKKLGLDNIRNLLGYMGSPQAGLRFIHIAGTNGKGSTAAMIASVMEEAGYRTGLYTSPYLQRFTERIRVDGAEIPERALVSGALEVRAAIARMAADGLSHPTELEAVLAIALLHYARERCDVVVLEVGMGGRFDPTNVIQAPEAAIITTIDYDHVAHLGGTLEKIAFEKGGIIKPGCDAILYPQQDSVRAVFEGICAGVGARLRPCDFSSLERAGFDIRGQTFHYRRYRDLRISLLGDYQIRNAALVVDAVEAINENSAGAGVAKTATEGGAADAAATERQPCNGSAGAGAAWPAEPAEPARPAGPIGTAGARTGIAAGAGLRVSEGALRRGLLRAKWPGRMEVVAGAGAVAGAPERLGATGPAMVIDAAHNPECARALKGALLQYFPGKKIVFVFGMVRDKDYAAVIDAIMPIAYAVFTVTPPSERALGAEEMAAAVRERVAAMARAGAMACTGSEPTAATAHKQRAPTGTAALEPAPTGTATLEPSPTGTAASERAPIIMAAPGPAPTGAAATAATGAEAIPPDGGGCPLEMETAAEQGGTGRQTADLPDPSLAGRVWACATIAGAVGGAMSLAAEIGGIACAFGSLYYIGEVRSLFGL